MKKRYWLLGGCLLLSGVVQALTLEQVKKEGRAGETLSGYLAPIKQDAETLELVKKINSGRAEEYQRVAVQNHISTDEVAKMVGRKLVTRAPAGETVKGLNGQWMKKTSGPVAE